MSTRITLTLAVTAATLLGGAAFAHAQGSIFYRPDGNGYYYYQGLGPYSSVPAAPGYADHDVLHGELQYRDYARGQIVDTAARYGQLTPYQREVLRQQLTHSAARDGAYHQGYLRGGRAGYDQGHYDGWAPYRGGYGPYGGYGYPR